MPLRALISSLTSDPLSQLIIAYEATELNADMMSGL